MNTTELNKLLNTLEAEIARIWMLNDSRIPLNSADMDSIYMILNILQNKV